MPWTDHARWLLLTGRPGSGKTTIIRRALEQEDLNAGGFFTEEMREGGVRTGFRIETLEGDEAVLARRDTRSAGRHRVGAYVVDLEVMTTVAIPALKRAEESADLIVIDEIGKMEMLSLAFTRELERIAEAGPPVLGTILARAHEYADTVKARTFVKVIDVTPETRDGTLRMVQQWLREMAL